MTALREDSGPRRLRGRAWPVVSAALLGAGAALLVACGSSGSAKLIPAAAAGPLQSDFEEVAAAAQSGNGDCSKTETALTKTEHDFGALPANIDAGLRERLREGIENLRKQALNQCAQPLTPTTTTSTAKTTPTTTTTEPTTTTAPTTPETTPTSPPATSPTTVTPPGGGTPAPDREETPPAGVGQGGGTGAGEGGPGNGNGRGGEGR